MENLRNKVYQMLRGSESFFKTDMVYLAKGNFWQVIGQVTTSFLTLGLTILFANLLPKETYGLYKYVISLSGVLNIFTLTGMNQAVAQAVARGEESMFRASVIYQLKWNMLQLGAFLLISGYYFLNDNTQIGAAMFLLGVLTPLTLAFNTYGAFLEGKKEFQLNNLFSILSTFIYVFGMVLAILISGKMVWLVAAYSFSTFVSTLIFYLITVKRFNLSLGPADETLVYGRQLTFIGAIGPIVTQLDKIILNHFWGPTQLAVYSLATAIPERATSLIKSWVSIGLPKFSTRTPEEINQVFYARIFQGIFVGIICFAGYYLIAPYVFKYLIPKYMDGVFYSQLLAISFIFALPNRYISLLLISQKSSKLMFINNLINSTLRIILYITLGISGGILGLVIAHVLTNFLGMFINILSWRLNMSTN